LGGYHQFAGFNSHGLDTRGCFLIGFDSSRLSGCCRFRHRLFRLSRLPGGCHVWGLGSLRDRLRSWSGSWGRCVDFDNSPPSDDVAPPLAQVHLLGRGPDMLSFQGGKVPSGGALRALLGRPLCKSRLRFFPLYTATVVGRVISPATTALRLWDVLAKPKLSLRAETCAQRKSTFFSLLTIPAFDRIAGLSNRHLNCNWGICLR
jgi:hypothetical protein